MSKARTLANFVSAGNPLSDGTIAASELTGTLAVANGGTGQTTYTDGQVLIGNTTGNTLTKASLTAGTGITITPGAGSISIAANNAGTVTSVTGTSPVASSGGATPAISLSSGYGDTLNPYASKTANFVLAAPNGSAGVPTFRAVDAADIPTLNQNTTGNAATATSATSATNLAGGSNGTIPYQTASGTTAMLAVGTAGQLLQTNGAGAPTWITPASGSTADLQTFTSSGTWTKPAGVTFVRVCAWGGGGGGGSGRFNNTGGANENGGSAGGGGARVSMMLPAASITSTVTVTVGNGGNGGAARTTNGSGNTGTAGGTSSFGCYVKAYGGGAGRGGLNANSVSYCSGGGGGGGSGATGLTNMCSLTLLGAGPLVNSIGTTTTLTNAQKGSTTAGVGAYLACSAGGGGGWGGAHRANVPCFGCFVSNPGNAEWGGGGGGLTAPACNANTKGCGGGSIWGGAGGGAGGYANSGGGIGKDGGRDQYAVGGGGSGGNNAVGAAGTQSPNLSGRGGGGGGSAGAVGRAGGAGGIYGGGGGGGSGGGTTTSGAGGAGGKGAVIVYSW